MRANAVNLAIFTNALCYFNATPLSVAVLVPCAWGGNLACGCVAKFSGTAQNSRIVDDGVF